MHHRHTAAGLSSLTVASCLMQALIDAGVYSLVGAVGGERVSFDAWELIRPVTLTGYSSEDLDGSSLRQAAADSFTLLQEGKLTPPPWQTIPLEHAAEAHRLLERGGVRGRVLLVPPS